MAHERTSRHESRRTCRRPLGSLFPPGAVAADLREPGDPALLLPAEASVSGTSGPEAGAGICGGAAVREARLGGIRHRGFRHSRWPTTGSRSGPTPWSAALPTRRDFARRWSPSGGASARWDWTARWSAMSSAEIWPRVWRAGGNGVAPVTARIGTGRRGHLDILGQGGLLQMPVSAGARTPEFSGCAASRRRLGCLAGHVSDPSDAAHCHSRAHVHAHARAVSIPRESSSTRRD